MESDKKGIFEILKSLPIPEIIKTNAITAFAKGIGKIITSASGIPVAYFDSVANELQATSKARIALIEQASKEASKLFVTDSSLANRALSYFGDKIIGAQNNRESIANKVFNNLSAINISDSERSKEIDVDWLTMFWNLAETKTKEDVQEILAKILTMEIVKPTSISPNTLQLLTVLTSNIGDAFKRLCNISIDDGERCFVIHPNIFAFQKIGPLFDYDVSYDDLFELDGAGLIRSAETLMLNYSASEQPEFEEINFAGHNARLDISGLQLNLIQFTKSGRELRNLLDLSPNQAYLTALQNKVKDAFIYPI
ncbi:Protein of unknown function [Mucilaginibacter mallensis]|uniref:DUF2806 domain-containing protein n=1 Tax=Mucilaginibacter mallensis TaxID=652787 RepID=A0A1H2ADM5_MUCMA|nr:DUF2806 domain-containing protein [Mucilaginibacter mallensis]SDT43852.1 Protein of unknown function [Mucilaginibacter mallensis]